LSRSATVCRSALPAFYDRPISLSDSQRSQHFGRYMPMLQTLAEGHDLTQ
jgi:hypothetical protein